MARRAGFFGASESEREARLTQQRDYAAQLQEQVRAKQAQAEQEKVRRRHEQERARAEADALAQSTQQPLDPPLSASQPRIESPPQSPMRDHEVRQGIALQNWSPSKSTVGAMTTVMDERLPTHPASFALSPLVATFMPGPSIFDALLQSKPTRGLTPQIESLQKLRLQVETFWNQRHTALQTLGTKPDFILTPSPSASADSRFSSEEKRQLDQEIELSPRQEQDELELTGIASGLVGESVLIPLAHTFPSKYTSTSPRQLLPSSPPRSASAVHRRLAAASAAAASTSLDTCSSVLSHDSELLQYDQ